MGAQAGDAIGDFVTSRPAGDEVGGAFQPKDLCQAGPVVQPAQQAAGGERARLDPAVASVEGLGAAEVGWAGAEALGEWRGRLKQLGDTCTCRGCKCVGAQGGLIILDRP